VKPDKATQRYSSVEMTRQEKTSNGHNMITEKTCVDTILYSSSASDITYFTLNLCRVISISPVCGFDALSENCPEMLIQFTVLSWNSP